METKIEILDSPPDPYGKQEDDICELEHLRKLFIGGLAPYTNEDGLKSCYGQWGKVVDVVVMRDPNTKRSRGFGFITYTKSNMVDKAQEHRPHIIDGKTVEAKRALPRPEREARETNISVKKLFVGGLKDNHDEECLREYFAQFGNVVSVKILTDKTTGKRRGFAFIEYDDYDAVDKAILQRNHSIKYVVVDVKKSVYNYEQSKLQNSTPQQQQQQTISNITVTNNTHSSKSKSSSSTPGSYRHPAPPPPPQRISQLHSPPYRGPPPNYNCWGPPSLAMQNQYYQQNPPQSWNCPPNSWNGPPIHAGQAVHNWHGNPWGCTASAGPGNLPVRPPGVAPYPSPNWNPTSNGTVSAINNSQQPAPDFGSGYQQKYCGGPTKHNIGNNRMNPYNAPSANNMQPMFVGYGNYNNGHASGNFGNTNNIAMAKNLSNGGSSGGSKYRR